MHFRIYVIGMIIPLFITSLFAVDGVVLSGKAGKYGFSPSSEVVAYKIEADKVTGETELLPETKDISYYSPAFHMSGTYFACVRKDAEGARYLIAADAETGEYTNLVKVPGDGHYHVWWAEDGSIVYYPAGTFSLRKVIFDPQADKTVITDKLYALFQYQPQGRYVDMDGKCEKIAFRIYGNDYTGANKRSSDAMGPVPTDTTIRMSNTAPGFISACGCGNGVSASGQWAACLQNSGHSTIGIEKFDGTGHYNVDYADIESWCGADIGTGGDANRYSVNSDSWIATLPGFTNRFLEGGAECIVFNKEPSLKKAIMVTNFKKRGINSQAYVGSFWVSSQDQVNADLWHFVENRADWKTFWAKAVKGEAATKPADYVGAAPSARTALHRAMPDIRAGSGSIVIHGLSAESETRISLYTLSGRKIYRWDGKSAVHTVKNAAKGFTMVEIEMLDLTIAAKALVTD